MKSKCGSPAGRGNKRGQPAKGVSRAGIRTTFHLAVTTDGLVVEGFLSGGKENDGVAAPALVEEVIGCYVPADRGYDRDDFRRELEANNNILGKPVEYDRERYKQRS